MSLIPPDLPHCQLGVYHLLSNGRSNGKTTLVAEIGCATIDPAAPYVSTGRQP